MKQVFARYATAVVLATSWACSPSASEDAERLDDAEVSADDAASASEDDAASAPSADSDLPVADGGMTSGDAADVAPDASAGETNAHADAATSSDADALDANRSREASTDPGTALDSALPDAATPDTSTPDAGPDAAVPDLTPLAAGDGKALPFRVVDAEYSDALNRIVMVSSEPNRLITLDPETFALLEVALPLTPSSVSVAPDGLTAAVGHNGYVSIVALANAQRLHTHPVSADVSDVVLAGNGFVYAFPRIDQWVTLHSINVASGVETGGGTIRAGTVAKLHPAGDRMYGADRGLSPADIERYDLGQGTAALAYDSPYHGDHAMCGDLWISEEGARIFTACGNVFRASNVRADDMKYNGVLQGAPRIRHLDHSKAAKLVAIAHSGGYVFPGDPVPASVSDVAVFEDTYLNFLQRATLPRFQAGTKQYAAEGRFVFFNAQGTRLYVLVEAAAAAPIVNNYGLARYTLGGDAGAPSVIDVTPEPSAPVNPPTTPSAGKALGFRVLDAEYSRALDRIVALATSPDRLLLVNPTDGAATSVALPLLPRAISLHPQGRQAAVAHDGWISIVELDPLALNKSVEVSSPLVDVVFAGNGYVHGFPSRDQWSAIHSVKIADASETLSGGASIYAGTVARLHPAGDRMYGANRGLSPSDIERYNIGGGPAVYAYDSPYHGDYAMCGDLWFSEDGARIFTACGNVFRTSNVRADDMTYNGAFEGGVSIRHLDHSLAAGRVAVAVNPGFGSSTASGVNLYEHQFLNKVSAHTGPTLTISGVVYPTASRFVFFNAAGTKLYVLAEAVGTTGVNNDVLVELTL